MERATLLNTASTVYKTTQVARLCQLELTPLFLLLPQTFLHTHSPHTNVRTVVMTEVTQFVHTLTYLFAMTDFRGKINKIKC